MKKISNEARIAIVCLLVIAGVASLFTIKDYAAHGELVDLWFVAVPILLAGATYFISRKQYNPNA
ncbi:hypothetical protein [Hymenobacter sp. BT491]|uniref:hypothetical protein n=1 Tax=Hymenobacter sp. BT491 TaxID=2766779 RepID=UPI001653D2E5|nr:hypothetical protein [Hymenobacter sp. BT491]MBC6988911.1 hypothetical protein [Hymenobacter sp. BT491]